MDQCTFSVLNSISLCWMHNPAGPQIPTLRNFTTTLAEERIAQFEEMSWL